MKNITVMLQVSLLTLFVVGCGNTNNGTDLSHADSIVNDIAGEDAAPDVIHVDDAHADITAGDVSGDTNPGDTTVEDVISDVAPDAVTPTNIALNPNVSECGGFVTGARVPAEDSECGDDFLQWSVNAETGVISFVNAGVFLNCCGIHNVTVTQEGGVFVITEIDEPEAGGGRCNCMCMFDFAVDMPGVDVTSISVRIDRIVTDESASTTTAWEGEIDLVPGEGEIVIKEDVGWCAQSVNIGLNPQFSDCGGFLPVRAAETADCGDETLQWTVNSEDATVRLINTNVWLNCCGTHTMSIFDSDGVYTLAEVDEPKDGDGRCKCMCLFDYSMELPGVFAGPVDVRITRLVTDSGESTAVIWEGTLDLSAETGEVIVKADVGYCG